MIVKMDKVKYLASFLLLIIIFTGCNKKDTLIQTPGNNVEWSTVNEDRVIQEYLQKDYSSIDLKNENEFSDLAIMDSDLEGKEIFFTAEVHGVKTNEELHMKFLKYFKAKTDFKYYLCENSYSNAYFINKYLDTGDIKILEEIYKPLKGTFVWNKDSYNHWKKLFEYNNSLPEQRRIQLVGVDIEHQPANAYRFLVDILPEKEAPEQIKEKIENIKKTFKDLDEYRYDPTFQCSRELQKDIQEKENIYKEYLGENFFGFNLVNSNILNALEAYKHNGNQVDWNNTSDKMIYENFQAILKEFPKGKYYGQWGLNHTFQAKEKEIMWFASYLNAEDSIFKDKVLTVIYNYDDCEQMSRLRDGTYGTDKIDIIFPEIRKTNDLIGGNLNIYKLTGEDSPFSDISMYYSLTNEKLDEGMLDFFQYIVCIKNSKATEPLNNDL